MKPKRRNPKSRFPTRRKQALDRQLTVQAAPIRPALPQKNQEILTIHDRLLREGKCNAFFRKQSDGERPGVFGDVVGDDRNWLFVVAVNPNKKVRFAKVTDNPGGWASGRQIWGIDAETQAIAGELSEQLLQGYRAELLSPTNRSPQR